MPRFSASSGARRPRACRRTYADNLRRFYQGRLPPGDLPHIDRFIADGLMRNRLRRAPTVFGTWDAGCARGQSAGAGAHHRIRVWQHVAHTDGDPGVPAAEIQPVLPASAPGRCWKTWAKPRPCWTTKGASCMPTTCS
ncbi:hypothetical protein GO496_02210 [Acidovorax citrulli]|nr:hypothetical protein [Paracidovorax citrulli]